MLHRNGTDFKVTANQMNVRSGTEMQVKTDRKDLHLSLREIDQGSWVIFEMPGFTKANSGKKVESLDVLRKANENSYFKDRGRFG